MDTTPLLSTAYLPPVEYFSFLMNREVWVESKENYCKQSYRNRSCILTGNGVQTLHVPVVHTSHKPPITEACIEYTTPWQRSHWRAITTAYNASPYFLYYQDALRPFYEQRFERLFDYNQQLTKTLLKLLGVNSALHLTTDYDSVRTPDLRTLIHPKQSIRPEYPLRLTIPYYQVFEDRFGFTPNLSVLDLLFNLGPEAAGYLLTLNNRFNLLLSSNGK